MMRDVSVIVVTPMTEDRGLFLRGGMRWMPGELTAITDNQNLLQFRADEGRGCSLLAKTNWFGM